MKYATLIVLLALLQYVYFTARVGMSRGKYGVSAPACDGDETWKRMFRVQQNTMEQLIVFVPATFAFAFFLSGTWVLAGGALFIIARAVYSAAYIKDPATRAPGMFMTLGANMVMLFGALSGLLMAW